MKGLGQQTIEHRKVDEAKKNSFQIEMKIKFNCYISKPLEGGQHYTQRKYRVLKQKYNIRFYENK